MSLPRSFHRPVPRPARPSVFLSLLAVLLISPAFAPAAQCTGPNCHQVVGSVSDATTGPWLSGHTYVVTNGVSVPTGETLTIQPGVVVKVQAGFITVSGTLMALGTAGQPIVFTSSKDDSVGGDTNGDGGASSPAPGDWNALHFTGTASASRVEHATIRYAGLGNFAPSVIMSANGVTFEHVDIVDGKWDGISFSNTWANIRHCHFQNLDRPMVGMSPHGIDNLLDNTGSGNQDGDVVWTMENNSTSLQFFGSATWSAANMINGTGAIVLNQSISTQQGSTLTWGPGLVLKLNGPTRNLTVAGSLFAAGTAGQPIVVTSMHDDDHGGDTSSGTPAPGDWQSVTVASNAGPCSFSHVTFRYGGGLNNGLLYLAGTAALDHCVFELSSSAGVKAVSAIPPTVSDCVFLDNAAEPITALPLGALANFTDNVAAGNGTGDVITLGGGTLTTTATLSAASAFNGTGAFVLQGSTQVGTGGQLTVDPGVIFKAKAGAELRALNGGELLIGGPGLPVVFTSLFDDSIGGDLNGDGNTTTPAPGDWSGVRLVFAAHSSMLENVLLRFAGNNAIALVQTDATLLDVTVDRPLGPGLSGNGDSHPTVSGCEFIQCGGVAPVHEFTFDALAGFTDNAATDCAGGDSLRLGGGTLAADATMAVANTLNQDGVLVLAGSLTVSFGVTLELAAGTVLKLDGDHVFNCLGSLVAEGTAGEPIVFTSYADDIGGDTNGDGPSEGAAGTWRQLRVGNASVLRHVRVRNAGSFGVASLEAFNGTPVLDQVLVERGVASALAVTGGTPTVTGCAFNDHANPAAGVTLHQLGGFSGNTASGNLQHDLLTVFSQGAYPMGGWLVTPDQTLNGSGVLRVAGVLSVSTGQMLAIDPGMVLKFTGPTGELRTAGTLLVQGSAADPVVFTSVHDDDFGGPDDNATLPQPGDWLGLRFQGNSDASVVDHAIVRYAGAGATPSVAFSQSNATLCNVHIEFGAGAGIDAGSNSAPTLKNVSIDDNGGDPILGITWNVLGNMSGISAMGNGSAFDTVVIESPVVVGEVTIEQENVFGPCIVVTVTPATGGANRLSFGRGLVVKAAGPWVALHAYEVRGTGLEKTVFTSIYDDEHGGDTNGDGGATVPMPGDWIGVRAAQAQNFVTPSATVEHALIRYAGAPDGQQFPVALRAVDVTSTRVEYSATGGVEADDCQNVIAFANADVGIRAYFDARNCTSVRNGGLGIRARKSHYCIAWHNGPTLTENFFEVAGPTIGCPPCAADITYSIGSNLGISPPVQGGGAFFGCPNTGWGNVITDPLFVDELGGNLALSANSPARNYYLQPCPPSILNDPGMCTPWGQGDPGNHPGQPAHPRDHLENPRRVKDTLTLGAPWRSDLGALERVNWTLEALGGSKLGQPLSVRVNGPAGSAALVVGLPLDPGQVEDLYVDGYGYLMLNPLFLLFLPPVPVGFVLDLPIPDDLQLLGLEVGLQAVVTPTMQPALQQLTNLYRPRLHN